MAEKYDVLGIGNAIVDVLSRADDVFLEDQKLAKSSMQLIDAAQAEALYSAMGPGVEISGGSAANTIAGLASFGATTSFIGMVKADQLGKVFRHDITALGVDYNISARVDGEPTARCLILVTPDGERTMNTFLGASQTLGPDDVDEAQVARASIVYLEGYLFDPAPAKEAFYKAARLAHKHGGRVALTLSDSFCVDRHREEFRVLVSDEVDILFANEAEIMSLYEVATFDEACAKVRADCPLAVLTRSAEGAVVISGEAISEVPAKKVAALVDTTGAGDLFAAGFLFGLSRDRALEDCAKLGAMAAAEVIGHMGARPEVSLVELANQDGLV